jgi:hypothetical protein
MQHILAFVVDVCDRLVDLQLLFITDDTWSYPPNKNLHAIQVPLESVKFGGGGQMHDGSSMIYF